MLCNEIIDKSSDRYAFRSNVVRTKFGLVGDSGNRFFNADTDGTDDWRTDIFWSSPFVKSRKCFYFFESIGVFHPV